MTISNRVGAIALLIVFILGVFLAGYNTGRAVEGCYIINVNRAAFQSDPAYWGGSMRTLVERCERGG